MRLIDSDALMEAMKKIYTDTDQRALYSEIWRVVSHAPAIDAVPVVRCNTCIYRHRVTEFWKPCDEVRTHDMWFCAAGKRREADADTP